MAGLRHSSSQKGFSLLELMVTLAIFGVLMSLAIPGIRTWRAELAMKQQAESIVQGLKTARGESVRRNAAVRFQLVNNFTNVCTVATNSNSWVVSFGIPACDRVESMTFPCDPAAVNSSCNDPYSAAANSILLKTSLPSTAAVGAATTTVAAPARVPLLSTVQTNLVVTAPGAGTASDNVLCFFGSGQFGRVNNADGRCTRAQNPANTRSAMARFDISDPGEGVCRHVATAADVAADRTLRCSRVEVSQSGDVRMCDPWVIHDSNPAPDFNDPRQCTCERGTATDQRPCP